MVSKESDVRRSNREAQRAYRERHAGDLRKARRVATALMMLRGNRVGTPLAIRETVKALSEFLTDEELKTFITQLKKPAKVGR